MKTQTKINMGIIDCANTCAEQEKENVLNTAVQGNSTCIPNNLVSKPQVKIHEAQKLAELAKLFECESSKNENFPCLLQVIKTVLEIKTTSISREEELKNEIYEKINLLDKDFSICQELLDLIEKIKNLLKKQ